MVTTLLDLDFGAGLLEGFLQALSLILRDTFLDGLGGVVDEFLGLLETQAGHVLNGLHDTKLLGLIGNTLQDDVERGLLLGSGGSTTGGGSGDCNGSSGGLDAVFLLQEVTKFFNFFNGKVNQFFSNSFLMFLFFC